MPDTTGVELLQFCKEISPSSYFLLITGVPTLETAIAAINSGADRYVIKDHELVDQLRRAVRQVDETLKLRTKPDTCAANCGALPAWTISSATAPRCAPSLT